jgi:hypothetical protein
MSALLRLSADFILSDSLAVQCCASDEQRPFGSVQFHAASREEFLREILPLHVNYGTVIYHLPKVWLLVGCLSSDGLTDSTESKWKDVLSCHPDLLARLVRNKNIVMGWMLTYQPADATGYFIELLEVRPELQGHRLERKLISKVENILEKPGFPRDVDDNPAFWADYFSKEYKSEASILQAMRNHGLEPGAGFSLMGGLLRQLRKRGG